MKPMYNTKTFTEIYENVTAFTTDYTTINLGGLTTAGLINKLYYLLYAKFGNTPIANMDINQFKYKLFSAIYMYGPTWDKRLDIQEKLRALDIDNLQEGALAIYNQALNPETAPATNTKQELDYINSQSTVRYTKPKPEAYGILWDLLATDVTADFLDKFNDCFKKFVRPTWIHLYEDDNEED